MMMMMNGLSRLYANRRLAPRETPTDYDKSVRLAADRPGGANPGRATRISTEPPHCQRACFVGRKQHTKGHRARVLWPNGTGFNGQLLGTG